MISLVCKGYLTVEQRCTVDVQEGQQCCLHSHGRTNSVLALDDRIGSEPGYKLALLSLKYTARRWFHFR